MCLSMKGIDGGCVCDEGWAEWATAQEESMEEQTDVDALYQAVVAARKAWREFGRSSGIADYERVCAETCFDEDGNEIDDPIYPPMPDAVRDAYAVYRDLGRASLRAQLAYLEAGGRQDYPGQRDELRHTVAAMDAEEAEQARAERSQEEG